LRAKIQGQIMPSKFKNNRLSLSEVTSWDYLLPVGNNLDLPLDLPQGMTSPKVAKAFTYDVLELM
jgi:hypothetical protein